MKRRSMEEGQELVEMYRASGLTQERFAKKTRINVAVLRYWLRRVREDEVGGSGPVRFVELAPGPAEAGPSLVRIETPTGVVVQLERLPTSGYLVELIHGLDRR